MSFSRVGGVGSQPVVGFPVEVKSPTIKGYDPFETRRFMEQEQYAKDTIALNQNYPIGLTAPLFYRSETSQNSVTKALKKVVRSLSFSKKSFPNGIDTHFSNGFFQKAKQENSVIITVMKLKNHIVARCQHLNSGSETLQDALRNDLNEFYKKNANEDPISLESQIIERVPGTNGKSVSFNFYNLSHQGTTLKEQSYVKGTNFELMSSNLMDWIILKLPIDARFDNKVYIKEEVIKQLLPRPKGEPSFSNNQTSKIKHPGIPSAWMRPPAQKTTKIPMKNDQSSQAANILRGSIDDQGVQYSKLTPPPTPVRSNYDPMMQPVQRVYSRVSVDDQGVPIPNYDAKQPVERVYSRVSVDDQGVQYPPKLTSPPVRNYTRRPTDGEILPKRNYLFNSDENKSAIAGRRKHGFEKAQPLQYNRIPDFLRTEEFKKRLELNIKTPGNSSGTNSE